MQRRLKGGGDAGGRGVGDVLVGGCREHLLGQEGGEGEVGGDVVGLVDRSLDFVAVAAHQRIARLGAHQHQLRAAAGRGTETGGGALVSAGRPTRRAESRGVQRRRTAEGRETWVGEAQSGSGGVGKRRKRRKRRPGSSGSTASGPRGAAS